jgi:hypothetical protein
MRHGEHGFTALRQEETFPASQLTTGSTCEFAFGDD